MFRTALLLARDLLHFVALACSSHKRLAAENLFLCKQLAFYVERKVKPRRLNDATRIAPHLARAADRLATASRRGTTRDARAMAPAGISPLLAVEVTGPWRPRIPVYLQNLIADMAQANVTWGEERIAAELLLKLGITISPRTMRRYMRRPVPSRPCSASQTWSTFLRNRPRHKFLRSTRVARRADSWYGPGAPEVELQAQRHATADHAGITPSKVRDVG